MAALSAWLLAGGRRRCYLYTDLANPTSNAIYRRIGYRQVAESAEFAFEAPGGPAPAGPLEPGAGVEPATSALQERCSAN